MKPRSGGCWNPTRHTSPSSPACRSAGGSRGRSTPATWSRRRFSKRTGSSPSSAAPPKRELVALAPADPGRAAALTAPPVPRHQGPRREARARPGGAARPVVAGAGRRLVASHSTPSQHAVAARAGGAAGRRAGAAAGGLPRGDRPAAPRGAAASRRWRRAWGGARTACRSCGCGRWRACGAPWRCAMSRRPASDDLDAVTRPREPPRAGALTTRRSAARCRHAALGRSPSEDPRLLAAVQEYHGRARGRPAAEPAATCSRGYPDIAERTGRVPRRAGVRPLRGREDVGPAPTRARPRRRRRGDDADDDRRRPAAGRLPARPRDRPGRHGRGLRGRAALARPPRGGEGPAVGRGARPAALQRFRNEAQAAAQLHHTNIVPVYAVGCERGVHFYAMQFIEGQSLAEVIRELRQPPAPAARRPDRGRRPLPVRPTATPTSSAGRRRAGAAVGTWHAARARADARVPAPPSAVRADRPPPATRIAGAASGAETSRLRHVDARRLTSAPSPASACRPPRRWTTPTASASSTATSSPPTCCSTPRQPLGHRLRPRPVPRRATAA